MSLKSKITRQVTVMRDGNHNGFTDLQYWRGQYWVSYRKGSAHASFDGETIVAVSTDRTRFREVARLKVPGDNRDPKLFVTKEDQLAITIPSWPEGSSVKHLDQYVAFSPDGMTWGTPKKILEDRQWLWRVREHEGIYYGLVQVVPVEETTEWLMLYTSTDLVNWTKHCTLGSEVEKMNESDIHFFPNGEAWVIARGAGDRGQSWFAKSSAPYKEWKVTSLDSLIHAPIFLSHKDKLYVAGRRNADFEKDTGWSMISGSHTAIWRVEEGKVDLALKIPSSGDCSYPGFIKDPEGRICLSYYSQHAYHFGIVPMSYRWDTKPPHGNGDILPTADIFFAEIDLDEEQEVAPGIGA